MVHVVVRIVRILALLQRKTLFETKNRTLKCLKWHYSSVRSLSKSYLVTLAKIQDTPAREVAMSHSRCNLSFDLIGEHQNKRLYVTEIILSLMFADVFFRRERSDDRKYDLRFAGYA